MRATLRPFVDILKSVYPTPPSPASTGPIGITRETEIWQIPEKYSVKVAYMGAVFTEINTKAGDSVIVYAWESHGMTAVAFNTRNEMAGRIAATKLDISTRQTVPDSEVRVPSVKLRSYNYGDLVAEPRQNIRICK